MVKPRFRVGSGESMRFLGATTDDYIGQWNSYPVPLNQKIYETLKTLRARSREQLLNNDYAARYASMMRNNIVGSSGITLQARSKNGDESLDKRANKIIERAWLDWSRDCDFSGEESLIQIENLIVNTLISDGEVFVIKSYKNDRFSLQVVDPERCDTQLNKDLGDGKKIVMGIEYDADGRTIAYHFLERLRTVYDQYPMTGIKTIRVLKKDCIHVYVREQVGQTRGLPWLKGSLYRLKLLEQYENVALIASKLGAASGGFYTRDENAEAGTFGREDGEFIEERRPGDINVVPQGWKYETYDPTYPQAMYSDFMKKALRGVSSGLGVSYNILASDYSDVNFSSIRASVLEDREEYKAKQTLFIEKFMTPVFESWLSHALLSNKLVDKRTGRPLPLTKFDKFREVSFTGRRWDWVDPVKDAKGKRELYDLGALNVSDVIRESGRDPDEVFEEREKENERMEKIRKQEEALNGQPKDQRPTNEEVPGESEV